jgi:signal transduction histidine kinase
MSAPIHILGGGLVGLSCGLELLRAGRSVTLLDRGRAGRGASWAAAGMLAPRFEADFDDVEMIRLLVESQRRWAEYADSLHPSGRAAVDYDDTGTLFVALDRDDEEAARRWYDFARQYDLPVERLDRDALLEREPLLSARARMAVVCAGDHQLDNRKLVVKERLARDLPQARIDPAQMKQVLLNLLKNAMQATAKGGSVSLATGATPDDVWISVADSGSGIPADELNRIFEPFYTTKQKGTGLGLMIVQRIMRDHGGQVGIESKEGVGTIVSLQFPRKDRRVRMLQ